jgi:hypothetical protein
LLGNRTVQFGENPEAETTLKGDERKRRMTIADTVLLVGLWNWNVENIGRKRKKMLSAAHNAAEANRPTNKNVELTYTKSPCQATSLNTDYPLLISPMARQLHASFVVYAFTIRLQRERQE